MEGLKIIANEVLPVYETAIGKKVVNARELHEQLMVGKEFSHWISDRIEKYEFVEGEDFSSFLAKSNGGRPRVEFVLTLDAAKEIAMVQSNEMGRMIRKYFIEVEKRFTQQAPKSQAEMLLLYAQQMVAQEQRVAQIEQKASLIEQENQVLKHRVDNLDLTNIQGTPRQRLNAMVRRLANQEGVPYGNAWKSFVQAFNTAYKTNLELKRQHHINKIGKDISRPQFLEEIGMLEDAIRVADKLLNQNIAN